jgi:GT2 family glycosyltransferase
MINYGFVVLNYNNYKDTFECVDSILKIENYKYKIVVVDNCSENNSYLRLKDNYSDINKIIVLHTSPNCGYSGGNNIGIKFLLDNNVNNIFIAQNDTILESTQIVQCVESLNLLNVGMLGPQIVTANGSYDNPHIIKPDLLYFFNLFFFKKMNFFRNALYKVFPKIESFRENQIELRKKALTENIKEEKVVKVYALHGSFLFLTPKFLEVIKKFDDKIYLYGEEDLLAWKCEQAGLERQYLPFIKVYHKKNRSISMSYSKHQKAMLKKIKHKSQRYIKSQIRPIQFLKCIRKYR